VLRQAGQIAAEVLVGLEGLEGYEGFVLDGC
jgi:hypothetical protein